MGVLWALTSGTGVAVALLQGSAGPLIGVAISASLLPPVVNCVSMQILPSSSLPVFKPEKFLFNLCVKCKSTRRLPTATLIVLYVLCLLLLRCALSFWEQLLINWGRPWKWPRHKFKANLQTAQLELFAQLEPLEKWRLCKCRTEWHRAVGEGKSIWILELNWVMWGKGIMLEAKYLLIDSRRVLNTESAGQRGICIKEVWAAKRDREQKFSLPWRGST